MSLTTRAGSGVSSRNGKKRTLRLVNVADADIAKALTVYGILLRGTCQEDVYDLGQ
jgi:hypothetical protein